MLFQHVIQSPVPVRRFFYMAVLFFDRIMEGAQKYGRMNLHLLLVYASFLRDIGAARGSNTLRGSHDKSEGVTGGSYNSMRKEKGKSFLCNTDVL